MTVHYDMPFDEYAAAEGLNASAIKEGRKSMLAMNYYIQRGKPTTGAMTAGINIHSVLLEPERFAAQCATYTGELKAKTKVTKAWKEFAAECAEADMIPLLPDEAAELDELVDCVYGVTEARRILEATKHEVTLFWDDPMIGQCKARLDCLSDGILCDVKSGATIDKRNFERTCFNLGYPCQFGWYLDGAKANGINPHVVAVIAVTQKRPFDCVVYYPDNGFIVWGQEEAREIALRYRASEMSGHFQGVSCTSLPLELPAWVKQDDGEKDISTGEMEAGEL